MLGAIIGDINGSVFEIQPIKSKEFSLYPLGCGVTDDSIMTIAVANACTIAGIDDELSFKNEVVRQMKEFGRKYYYVAYGRGFAEWLVNETNEPYNSFGNGSAMRVSSIGWCANSLDEAEKVAKWSAEVTHNHPEGIKGAQAVAAAIYMARTGKTKDNIKEYINEKYYNLDFSIDEIRADYKFEVSCQKSVPQAIQCFLEAVDFEDSIRNAVSLGGDADTQAAIAGSITEAFFGIPCEIENEMYNYLDVFLLNCVDNWTKKYY